MGDPPTVFCDLRPPPRLDAVRVRASPRRRVASHPTRSRGGEGETRGGPPLAPSAPVRVPASPRSSWDHSSRAGYPHLATWTRAPRPVLFPRPLYLSLSHATTDLLPLLTPLLPVWRQGSPLPRPTSGRLRRSSTPQLFDCRRGRKRRGRGWGKDVSGLFETHNGVGVGGGGKSRRPTQRDPGKETLIPHPTSRPGLTPSSLDLQVRPGPGEGPGAGGSL